MKRVTKEELEKDNVKLKVVIDRWESSDQTIRKELGGLLGIYQETNIWADRKQVCSWEYICFEIGKIKGILELKNNWEEVAKLHKVIEDLTKKLEENKK